MDIAEAEREEGRAAHVEIVAEVGATRRRLELRSGRPVERREAGNQANGPYGQ